MAARAKPCVCVCVEGGSEVAASWLRPAVADSHGDLLSALVPVCGSLSTSSGESSSFSSFSFFF